MMSSVLSMNQNKAIILKIRNTVSKSFSVSLFWRTGGWRYFPIWLLPGKKQNKPHQAGTSICHFIQSDVPARWGALFPPVVLQDHVRSMRGSYENHFLFSPFSPIFLRL